MTRTQKRIQQKPGLTKGLLVSITNKQKLYQSYFLNGNVYEKSFYKLYANKLIRVKNFPKKMYYKAAISEQKNDPRELGKLIHSVISSKPSSATPSKINVDDLVIDDPPKISHLFNDYFTKIGHSIANTIDNTDYVKFTTYLRNSVPQIIVLTPPLRTEIHNIIKSLNANTGTGYDNISSFFLHLGGDVLAPNYRCISALHSNLAYFHQFLRLQK